MSSCRGRGQDILRQALLSGFVCGWTCDGSVADGAVPFEGGGGGGCAWGWENGLAARGGAQLAAAVSPKGSQSGGQRCLAGCGINHSLSFVPALKIRETSEHRSVRCEILAKPFASLVSCVGGHLIFRREGSSRFGFLLSSSPWVLWSLHWAGDPQGPCGSPCLPWRYQGPWQVPHGACPPHPSGCCQPHACVSCHAVCFYLCPHCRCTLGSGLG